MDTTQSERTAHAARFDELVSSHLGIVAKVVRTYCPYPSDQPDLAQEIKVQLWRAFARFDDRRRFSTWMYRIALNVAISWRRRDQVRGGKTVRLEEVADQPSPRQDSSEEELMRDIIARLDPLNRALLLLYLEDLSHAEIGEIMGITPGNVATKLSRLKQKIKQQLPEEEEITWN